MMFQDLIRFVKYYGKGRRLGLFGFLILSFLAGSLEFIGIGLIYPFILMIITPEVVINTSYYNFFTEITGRKEILFNTFLIGFFAVIMFVSKNILMMICLYLQNKFVTGWKNDINKMFMRYYLYAPYRDILKTSASEKIYNLTVLTAQTLETFVLRSLNLMVNSIIVAMILILLFIKLPLTALATGIFLVLSMILQNSFFKKKTNLLSQKIVETSLKNNNQIIENIKNLKEMKILNAEEYFYAKFSKIQEENNEIIFKNTYYASLPPYMIEILIVFALLILIMVITLQNIGYTTKIIASYGLIIAAIFRIAPALNRIQISLNHINTSKSLVRKMNDEYEKCHFDEIVIKPKTEEVINFNDKLELKNIKFSYKKNKPVIKDLSLEIMKGEFVGIIGHSGAGKSTLADIIMGLLPVDTGTISVDGVKITNENIFEFRKIVGYVPQQMNILEESFRKNVAWGIESDKIDDEQVKKSLKQAQIYEIVAETKDGINTILTSYCSMSQGQKQRLIIARALYKNPQLLIFDEATSSLDVEVENEITQMLISLKGEKTIVAIAHRLSTLKACDKLIYIKDGGIVDVGSFEELSSRYEDFERLIKLSKI